jgi:filamentous hemagglutinin family protein
MSPAANLARVQRAPGHCLSTLNLSLAIALSLTGLLCGDFSLAAGPLPQGGHFVGGTGSIVQNGANLNITQVPERAIIEWNSFSIGAGHTVSIQNGAGGTLLNRVTGNEVSAIRGSLIGTGNVYLINPHGVLIGRSGVVSAGGTFLASTLDIPNSAILNPRPIGGMPFIGTAPGNIVNLGKIDSSRKDVFLISSNKIRNAGTISAPNGNVELAVGRDMWILQGEDKQEIAVLVGSGGKVMTTGTIEAAIINLQAADGNIFALAGHSGALRATGTATRNGHVWLVANTGDTFPVNTGYIDARGAQISARNADGSGGAVDMSGKKVDVGGADVRAKTWNITTGNFLADAPTTRTLGVSLDRGTSIVVDAVGTDGLHGANGQGDIAIESSVRWRGDASLTLQATHSVSVAPGATIANKGAGSLVLFADWTGYDKGGSVTNQGTIDWSRSTGTVSAYYDMNGSYTPGTVRSNPSWRAAPFTGLLTQVTAYQLVNSIADLNAVNSNLDGIYAFGNRSIDFTDAPEFAGIGSATTPFNGQFDGRSQAAPVNVHLSGADDTGLFRVIGRDGVVRNLGLESSATSSAGPVGLLAGTNYGLIVQVGVSGTITLTGGTNTMAGGLVGHNLGRIEKSQAYATINGAGNIGGLVGRNDGAIDQSSAYNYVTAAAQSTVGGLAGTNNGAISRSYALGSVTGGATLGGLAGSNTGAIGESYAKLTLTPGAGATTGGIAGTNSGRIGGDVFWNSESSGAAAGVGSGTPVAASSGLTDPQLGEPASFGPTWDFSATGTWAATSGGPRLRQGGF